MMKSLLAPATTLAALFLMSAYGCSNTASNTTKSFPVADFSELDLEVLGEVYYEQSDSLYVTASGSTDLVEELHVTHDGNKLEIELENIKTFSLKRKDLVIRVGSPRLEAIDHNSIGTLHIPGTLAGERLRVRNEGAGEIKIADCRVASFNLVSKGVGSIEVGGTANHAAIELEGVGTLNCTKLKTTNTTVVNKGVGDVMVHATDTLNATLSGTGSIKYYGNPGQVNAKVSGLGQVTNMQQ